jgi:hypothetical protein
MAYQTKVLHPAKYETSKKVYGLEGKRLIGHSEKEDYYEDTEGNTYSFDGKKLEKLSGKKEIEKEKPAYFYQWGKHHTSKYGGQDGELNVYEIKDGEFVLVGSAFVQTRAMKGFEGEAMDILLKEGKISKQEYDKNRGYYRRDSNNIKISSAGDMY